MNNAHHFIRKGIYIISFFFAISLNCDMYSRDSSRFLFFFIASFFFVCHPTFLMTVKTAAESLYYDDKFCGRISLLYSEFICYCCYYYLTIIIIIIITYVSRVFVATVLSFGIVERPQKKDVPLGATVNNTHNQTNITKDKTMYKVKYKKRKFNIDSTISCRLPSAD